MLQRATRIVYLVVGLAFVGLGVLGAFLPVLPTTPLLLIALWAFSRSSARLERWLLEHPRFGPRLVAWRTHRVIPWSAKLVAWGSMAASLTLMIATGRSWYAVGAAAAVMAIGAGYVASRPSRPPAVPPTPVDVSIASPSAAARSELGRGHERGAG